MKSDIRAALTWAAYLAIFIILFLHAHDTGVIDGSIMLLLVPFLVNTGIDTWRDCRRALKYCEEDDNTKEGGNHAA